MGADTSQRGFTLAEVMISFLILMVVITMPLAAFLERNRRLEQAREIMLAYQALSNEAEYRRRMSFGSLETQPSTFVSDTTVLEPLTPFVAEVAVEQTTPGVKNVTMSIRWRNGRQAELALVRVDTGGSNLW